MNLWTLFFKVQLNFKTVSLRILLKCKLKCEQIESNNKSQGNLDSQNIFSEAFTEIQFEFAIIYHGPYK